MKPNKVPYNIPMPNNMGMVRYVLALSVILAHFNDVMGTSIWFPVTSGQGVGGFFALSGFLIYGSFLKKNRTSRYVRARFVRLMPAYLSTVLFFALALCAFSSLPAKEYFGSWHFWKYLLANLGLMNFIEPTLPGVFTDLHISAVNSSLWTMKVEWLLYLSVPLTVWLVRRLKANPTLTFTVIVVASMAYRLFFTHLYQQTGTEVYDILSRQIFGQLSYFYCGVLIYYWFDLMMKYKWAVIAAALLLYPLGTLNPYFSIIFTPVSLSVIVVWVSMVGRWGTFEGRRDNVSYNMYLLHFPVLQIAAQCGLLGAAGTAGCLCICLAVIILLSIAMNAWVEKPLQRRF